MKRRWLFSCYIPLLFNMWRTSEEDWRWVAPVYVYAAVGVLFLICMLLLLTWEPRVSRKKPAPEKASDRYHDPVGSDLSVPLMQMQWQGNN